MRGPRKDPGWAGGLGSLLASVAVVGLCTTPAVAQSPDPGAPAVAQTPDPGAVPPPEDTARATRDVDWEDERWRAFDATDWVIVGSAITTVLIATAIGPRSNPRRGGVLFDEGARDALRLPNERTRRIARDASDILLTTHWGFPILIDGFAVAGWYHQSPELAREMLLMNAEVFAVTAALQLVANNVASRERPYGRTCGTELEDDIRLCNATNRFHSFFSGHTSQAFASAAVTCVHHANVPLYGGGTADLAPCLVGLGTAATTGLLRVMGDQHYVTDVLTGAAIGTATGLLLPWLLHYARAPADPDSADFTFHLTPTQNGLGAAGTF